MRYNRRGFTMIELLFSITLSLIVLSVGYSAYFSIVRADDVERRREQLNLTAQNAMARIKGDVRSASSITASGGFLTISTNDGRVEYKPTALGVERIATHGRCLFKGVTASFTRGGRGVTASVKARAQVHRRAIRVDLDCFVTPRG